MNEKKLTLAALAAAVLALGIALSALLIALFPSPQPETQPPAFALGNFTMERSVAHYEYMEDTVAYTGEGQIICTDTEHTYLVLLRYTDATREEMSGMRTVVVENGAGDFTTYDYGDEGALEQPQYTFTVVSYSEMQPVPTPATAEATATPTPDANASAAVSTASPTPDAAESTPAPTATP